MKSIHDNNIYSLEVICEQKCIILHTEFLENEYTDIKFHNVVGHQFNNVLKNNIILDIEIYPPDAFYDENHLTLQNYVRYGLEISFKNKQEFIDELSKNNLKIFVIDSSHGLAGWIIATNMDLEEKLNKWFI